MMTVTLYQAPTITITSWLLLSGIYSLVSLPSESGAYGLR